MDHGTALGDATRYDYTPVKSGQKRMRGFIDAGQCGFRGCTDDRIGGMWADGGSYMCEIHRMLLFPLRLRIHEGLDQKAKQELRAKEGLSSSDD